MDEDDVLLANVVAGGGGVVELLVYNDGKFTDGQFWEKAA